MDGYAEMECVDVTTAIRWMDQLLADGGATEAAKLVAIKAYRQASLRLLENGEELVDALMGEAGHEEEGGQSTDMDCAA